MPTPFQKAPASQVRRKWESGRSALSGWVSHYSRMDSNVRQSETSPRAAPGSAT